MSARDLVSESNPVPEGYHDAVTANLRGSVDWANPGLERVIRFRLVGDPGFPFLDVGYCHGQMRDGRYVRVELPFMQLPKAKWKTELVRHAQLDGVNAKRLGMFDNASILV
jgi:hypothetical protein